MTRNTQTEQPGSSTSRHAAAPSHMAGEQDAIELLTEEHRKVQSLFEQFKHLKEQEDASSESKRQLVEQCCNALTVHAQIEEEIFYPAIRKAIGDDDMMNEAVVEHASAKQFIAQIGRMKPEDELYDAMFTVLGEYVNHHIEEEETEMFKKARKSQADLHMLADELDQRRTQLQEEIGAHSGSAQKRGSKGKQLH